MSANRFCEHCRAPLGADARFCDKCGRAVSASSMPTAAPVRSGKPIWLIVGCITAFVAITCLALVATGGFLFWSMNSAATPKTETVNQSRRGGAFPIQINVTAPEGVQVIEKAAVLVSVPGTPLRTLNLGIVLSSSKAVLGFRESFQIWSGNIKDKPSETRYEQRLWMAIPARQSGARFIKLSEYSEYLPETFPYRIDVQLSHGDFYNDRPKDLELLNNTAFANPYFTPTSANMTVKQDPASGLFNVETKGKVRNNLPVEAAVSGLFFFYDAKDQIIGFTTTICSDQKTYGCGGTLPIKVPARGELELSAVLPYPLEVQPTKVVLYPFVDSAFAQYLNKIK